MKSLLQDQEFQKHLASIAAAHKLPLAQVQAQAEKYWEEIYTEHKPLAQLLGIQGAQYILSRGYDRTIDVRHQEIRALSKLMQRHPVAFVMTHKTYIDMIVLGLVLLRHGLPLPYTFAGINMAFPGLAQLGKQTGVIFIRRSFRDNVVYKATLRHFIATVVQEKGHFMWALEGTRSRTGKLVWPKMGILKYIREAELHAKTEVKYVPVSVVYDLIPDVKEMTAEVRGKEKKAESLVWFLNYIRNLGNDYGRIALRFGEPVPVAATKRAYIPGQELVPSEQSVLPRFAFGLANGINKITPVTTVSLICTALLSKFAMRKTDLEHAVADLMYIIESHAPDALVDRGKPLGQSVQIGLNLLLRAGIIRQIGKGLHAKYGINAQEYLSATYYANMAAHHLYRRAFIELALVPLANQKHDQPRLRFWSTIMALRDLFKFEFFYPEKPVFSDKVEEDLAILSPRWRQLLQADGEEVMELLQQQELLVAPVVLLSYLEAYRVVARQLLLWEDDHEFDEQAFLDACMLTGEEMKWQGEIHRIESVSKPFLKNGLRLARNRKLLPGQRQDHRPAVHTFLEELERLSRHLHVLQELTLARDRRAAVPIPLERQIVPGSKTASITEEILQGEEGPHIAAFFDLDRTLIKGFSAKEFVQARILSGKMSAQEIIAQFAGALIYAMGNGNFAGLAAISARGIKDIDEQVFVQVGEEVYLKHLAETIYPEARALVAAHLAKGHTVAIVSAATPYQVNPIARDLGIEHVMCTRMEVKNGKFTGYIIEPACWGDGKAHAAHELEARLGLDLSKSYFYTDSAEDLPLLEIVGHPRPMNPDIKLSAIAFQRDWPIYRFNDETRPGITNLVRTALTAGSLIPAAVMGLRSAARTLSLDDGINAMIASVGDFGTAMAGIRLVVKGEENLWNSRPAVFLFNHQSSADLFIVAKLLRRDVTAVAKQELRKLPVLGQMMEVAGVVFLDRANREKAIAALQPAVETLRSGKSIA
ncbi:MAG: HAD-IB family hydrolase, partial [Bacteroidetes bacterium]